MILVHILLVLPDNGEALSWGGGASGRLGHGHESGILGFVKSNRSVFFLLRELACLCSGISFQKLDLVLSSDVSLASSFYAFYLLQPVK